jgi:nucleotide-binding universal stress UspA family protein
MKRVLLPVDGSECAQRAVKYVLSARADYRNPDDFEIHLVNVQSPLSGDITQFFNRAQIAAYHHDESEKALQGARGLLDAAGAKYTSHTPVGRIAEVIAEMADKLHCDHIVMGTHGRGALAELLVGSITLKVVHLARVPVLLVK